MDENLMVGDPNGEQVVTNDAPVAAPVAPVADTTEVSDTLILDNNTDYKDGIPESTAVTEEPLAPEEPETPEEPTAPVVAPVVEAPAPVVEAPKQEQLAPEPGEYTPQDYSFDVTLADGTTIKISSPEDLKQFDADTDFGTPQNFLDMQVNYMNMVNSLKNDKAKHEESVKAYEAQKTQRETTEAQINTLIGEVDYLDAKGLLPKIDDKFKDVAWDSEEAQKDEGVKARTELFDYRFKENEARAKAGLPPMGIVDAYNQRKIEQMGTKAQEVKVARNEQTKQKAALISSPSSTPASNVPAGMIIGEGGSVRDISTAYMM